jgi:hypothetical protein
LALHEWKQGMVEDLRLRRILVAVVEDKLVVEVSINER